MCVCCIVCYRLVSKCSSGYYKADTRAKQQRAAKQAQIAADAATEKRNMEQEAKARIERIQRDLAASIQQHKDDTQRKLTDAKKEVYPDYQAKRDRYEQAKKQESDIKAELNQLRSLATCLRKMVDGVCPFHPLPTRLQ
jgi:hypothetical protein